MPYLQEKYTLSMLFFPVLSRDLDPVQDEINDLFREVSVERFVGQEQTHIQWANDDFSHQLRIDGCSDLPLAVPHARTSLLPGQSACSSWVWRAAVISGSPAVETRQLVIATPRGD